MSPKEFAKYVSRDMYCLHCGENEAISPNHRINRGMGGSKNRNRPSNIVILCSVANSLIESDADWAETAKRYGWKLLSWQDPEFEPVYDMIADIWYLLDDEYSRGEFIR